MRPLPRQARTASSADAKVPMNARLPLLLITLIAAALRLYHLGHLSLWYDEAATVILSKNLAQLPQSLTTSAPLPFVVAHYWDLLGQSEFWVRLWAALLGTAIVPLVWALGRRLFGSRAGLFAAALIAVNPLCIYYSQEARGYSMLPFFVIASAYFWVVAAKRTRWWPFGLFASLTLALAFYSHYCAVLWIASLPLSMLVMARSRRGDSRIVPNLFWLDLKTLAASFVLISPWLMVFLDKATTTVSVADFWIPKPTAKTLLISLENMLAGFQAPSIPGLLATALVTALAVLGLGAALIRGPRRGVLLVAVNASLPIVLAFAISRLAKNSIYLDRCLIASAVFLLVMAGYGMSLLRKKAAFAVMLATVVLLSFSLVNHYRNVIPDVSHCPGVRPRKEFRQAADFVRQNLLKGDLVAHTCRSSLAPFMVYLASEQRQIVLAASSEHRVRVMQKYPYKGLWSSRLSQATLPIAVYDLPPGYKRLVLVASEWDIGKGDFYSQEKARIKRFLDRKYPLLMSKKFYGAPLYFYDLTRPVATSQPSSLAGEQKP